MALTGSEILAKSLKQQGVDTFFYIMGGPMMLVETTSMAEGIRGIDVRHEQAAAMMAHAYARLRNRPGVCIGAAGPGTTNLVTGVANAMIDCAPVIALGGSSPHLQEGRGVFQEIDQVGIFRPMVKMAERIYEPARIPERIAVAFRQATSGKPGPVYLDFPGDVLYQEVEEDQIDWRAGENGAAQHRPEATVADVEAAIELLSKAERPVIVTGSGILWSDASEELQAWVEKTGIPFYTTPQGRGVVPDDHDYSYLSARSTAFREADLIMVVGTRLNYVISHAEAPRFNADAKRIRIDIDPEEIGESRNLDVGIVGDAKAVLGQLSQAADGRLDTSTFEGWRKQLGEIEAEKQSTRSNYDQSDEVPMHPLRLCAAIRDFLDRDDVLVVDGQEILNFGRQSIPTFTPGHRLNSGPFGTMGVGLPFGVGAKVAKPDKRVVVLHGDGSFGMNAMELDTAVRHNIPILCIISLNGGWTADPNKEKPGRELGYTRFDQMAESLGCYGEYVEKPEDLRPALERAAKAVADGKPALVNVLTDWRARAGTLNFSRYMT